MKKTKQWVPSPGGKKFLLSPQRNFLGIPLFFPIFFLKFQNLFFPQKWFKENLGKQFWGFFGDSQRIFFFFRPRAGFSPPQSP